MQGHSLSLIEELRQHIQGEVRGDDVNCSAYSVDASIYEIRPLAVVLPKDKTDLFAAIEVAAKYGVTLHPRGAATGITGGCLGSGIVIDTSKYLNRILHIDLVNESATVEPGVVQNALNDQLAPHGYRLGPDTSTGNRATIGGMVANNSAGARSLRYGKMVDHVQEVELLLSNGELIRFGAVNDEELKKKLFLRNREGDIYREVVRIRDTYRTDIEKHFPKIPRRASGYNLDELLKPGPLNLCKLICGSEGTLGIVTEVKVDLSRRPQHVALCILQFNSLQEAFEQAAQILPWKPQALEMLDSKIIEAGRQSPALAKRVGWIIGNPAAILVAEFEASTPDEVIAKTNDFSAAMQTQGVASHVAAITTASQMSDVWAVRESGLGLLLSKRSYSRAIAFLEDLSVGPEHLASFMSEFLELLRRHGKEAGIYGHVGSGCMHIRPYIDLRQPDEIELMKHLMEETAELLLKHHGVLSGEHGDGFVRSWLNEKMFGKRVYEAFVALKKVFDPAGIMNPGKIVATQGLAENLKMTPLTQQMKPSTFFDWSREGGIVLAADLCNGNGMCRKREGLMCPSFQAYGDEYHSTRARAQSFRDIFNGKLPPEMLTGHELYGVLEYCLECKGCKTQCPSQVDMAKMKAEFLYHYQEKHGYSLRSRLFGHISRLQQFASPLARLFNALNRLPGMRTLRSWIGIAKERSLPVLAETRFSTWFQQHKQLPSAKQVVLFNDTFNEFNQPEIGIATVQLLNALGFEVLVPEFRCCGRPLISKGLLKQAQMKAQRLVEGLWPYARQGLPIIGLEPSCLLTVKDEFRDLVKDEKIDQVIACCVLLDDFLAAMEIPDIFVSSPVRVFVHGHCHQKALVGMAPTMRFLKKLPGVEAIEIPSGCCGMAGSFGYEQEHYEMSMKIGENVLFPAVRKMEASDVLIADGMSCRSQVAHGTSSVAVHLASFLLTRVSAQKKI